MAESSKRRRISTTKGKPKHSSSSWSDLPAELLELILKKLSFVDVIPFKAVCSSWRSAAAQLQSQYHSIQITPWLMLPNGQEDDHTSRCFLNLAENKVYKFENAFEFEGLGNDPWCVGSSHGWLVILDDEANPLVFNPFSRVQIELPLFPNEFNPIMIQFLRKKLITKAVLLADPSRCKNFVVVVIYGFLSRLAFCKHGDTTWTNLSDAADQVYRDIICHNNQLYALDDNLSVKVWDFQGPSLNEIMTIPPLTLLKDVDSTRKFSRDICVSTQIYLVKTSSELLFIERFIRKSFRELGTEDGTQTVVCSYGTKMFYVFKLNLREQRWEKVESLNDQVLFLGGNQSISFSALDVFNRCKPNSIYFTDDKWNDEYDTEFSYGGHDVGLFNLDDQSITHFFDSDLEKIDPPPFWITPNPW